MPVIPVYHKDNPEGILIDISLWDYYKERGWVDAPAKLYPIEEAKESPQETIQTCPRCGQAKHAGFCKRTQGEEK